MKKIRTFILILGIVVCILSGCGKSTGNHDASEKSTEEERTVEPENHLIGVVTYDFSDEEVIGFRNYLENYITQCFPGVDFLYTNAVTSPEEETVSLQTLKEAGVEGILSFISYDIKGAVDYCSENGIYYMMDSGTISQEEFNKVEENPYFVGVIGPGNEMEYQAGKNMAHNLIQKKEGDKYFVLSGGAYFGNEMHLLRTIAVLDQLQEEYGVTFASGSRELAQSPEPVVVKEGKLTVCICPGFMNVKEQLDRAVSALKENDYSMVMAVMASENMMEYCWEDQIDFGMIDCFSEENQQHFLKGELSYLAGKYSSMIGPSFVAMYNALCGYADEFRVDGKAFSLTQGFWEASSQEEYLEKYALASGIYVNAYNYDDLYSVCKIYHPEATMEDLEKLTGAYTFEEAAKRRKTNK